MPRAALTLILAAIAWGACSPAGRRVSTAGEGGALPLLTMDELAKVDGRPLTLSQFASLRGKIRAETPQRAARLVIEAMALQSRAQEKGVGVPISVALDVVQYGDGYLALPEAESSLKSYFGERAARTAEAVRKDVERAVASSIIQENSHLIAELR